MVSDSPIQTPTVDGTITTATSLNGYPGMVFGSGGLVFPNAIGSASMFSSSEATIFAVVADWVSSEYYQDLIGHSTNSLGLSWSPICPITTDVYAVKQMSYSQTEPASLDPVDSFSNWSGNSLVSIVQSSNSLKVYKNGTLRYTVSSWASYDLKALQGAGFPMPSNGIGQTAIGQRGFTDQDRLNAKICEFRIYNKALGDTDRASIEASLMSTYNL
jgi:hypothetical protein